MFFFISDEANSIVGETSILSGLKAGERETFGCNTVHPAGIFKGAMSQVPVHEHRVWQHLGQSGDYDIDIDTNIDCAN